ncbi:TPA: glycosyltransferase family 4 protein [Clostridium botulinum]|uniref:Glycosyltransferase family 4 protein n=1 Tax=Clostridium botulinum TaxID=1491 RepID=A0A6G4HSJ7_CLOBO|nr:glycosyltransferase family 4 protein [Clostridium botulinum]APC78992.1 glycosyl transferases group 1 family protein [Clostridium botulinum]MBD5588050.1 glycosyltransferase family 4 protein [Clostridium botulinum]MBO0583158.1 glycosyltransferase [Clostridium botulinum]MCS4448406.1 glycosyltransferase family 4 protein [Clostridium botulinum]MCS4458307.1 glycosyltransferase family 4 protein [Clostridium botulinum]
MKTCIIATENYLYDSRMYWKEACSLKKHGYDVTCIVMSDTGEEETEITEQDIKYFKFKPYPNKLFNSFNKPLMHKYTFSEATFNRIFEIATKENFHIYHLHGLYSLLLIDKLKKINSKAKIIYEDREFYPDAIRYYNETKGICTINKIIYSYYMSLWEIMKAAKSDQVIVTDKNIFKRFKNRLGKNKVNIIYNFTNIEPIHSMKHEKKAYDIIYCGGVTKVRGIFQVVKSVKLAKNDGYNLKFLLIGPIDSNFKNELLDYINKNNLNENVDILGRINFSELPKYLEKSKIGIVTLLPIPKYKKNIPMKQFEYMAYGLPVVGSDLPPIKEFTGESNSGILVNPMNEREIWKAIKTLLESEEFYYELSKNGIQAVKEKYNWKCSEEKLISIYNNLLDKGSNNE